MKTILSLVLTMSILSGCSMSPPAPAEPKGQKLPVNPERVLVSDLEA